jgi:xanthine dehydrogenase YagS FAD-binding subunit
MTDNANANFEFLAGGTDLMERRRSGISRGPVAVLRASGDSANIAWQPDGSARVGAGVTMDTLATDAALKAAYPGVAAAAAGLATPQIRNAATLGGNLAQRTRCWYFRNPQFNCLKKGGTNCPSRGGNHLFGVIFDTGPCVAPHPSTMGVALLTYGATVSTTARPSLLVEGLFGDGRDGTRDNQLAPAEIIMSVALPPPAIGERAVYHRVISRAEAEWPLVEAVVRIVRDGDRIQLARVAVGGVAPVPLRLTAVEQQLEGAQVNATQLDRAAKAAAEGARPLPETGYKVDMLEVLVRDLLQQACAG